MSAQAFGKVAVLMGGWSAEREISLMSGQAVLSALQGAGVDAHGIDADRDVVQRLKQEGFDRAFIVLHGRGGEDGVVQAALELAGIPYTGCGVLASALGMDKWRSKLLWQAAGLPVPDSMVVDDRTDPAEVIERLGLPFFVKPANEGSSIAVTKVATEEAFSAAVAAALEHDPLVLAERYLGGGEYTVPVLAGEALPAIRIVPATEFYDYEAKYFRDDTQYLCPCGLDAEQERHLQTLALDAFSVLGGRDWGRVDILMDEAGRAYVLEANTVPGMTSHSLVPMAAKARGLDFSALCLRILETGMARESE